jgi:hypothetical protein
MPVGIFTDCALPLSPPPSFELRIENYEMTAGIPTNCASPLSPPLLRGGRGCVMESAALRHCERSEAIAYTTDRRGSSATASYLAVTGNEGDTCP